MRGCGSTARKKISTAIYAWRHSHALACGRAAAPSSHALHMHCVSILLLLMHCTHLRQLPLLDDRLRGFMARRDRRGQRDPRMHRLEHRYVLCPCECPGGRRKVHGGAQEHAAGRGAHPNPYATRAPIAHPPRSQAGVLLLISGIIQSIMSMTVLGFMIALLNAVNESSYCKDRYLSCTSSSDGTVCADWYGEDALCVRGSVGDDDYSCTTKSAHDVCKSAHGGAKDAVSVPLRVSIPQPLCYRCTIYAPAPHVQPLLLPLTHPHPPQGFIVIVFGITIVFLLIAGVPTYSHAYIQCALSC